MTSPQPGIFQEDSPFHYFLEYRRAPGTTAAQMRTALGQLLRQDDYGCARVFAFGKQLRQLLYPGAAALPLEDFHTLKGLAPHPAPATQSDLFCWIHGHHQDQNFRLALAVHRQLEGIAQAVLTLPAFRYLDNRDLSGFIDGTENPQGEEARAAALVPDSHEEAGGSFVLGQRWVHSLAQFQQLPREEQEKVIGRTRADSVQLPPERMPKNSHVSRSDLSYQGEAQAIYRRSVPYGTPQEHGLYFLAFACQRERFQRILENMFGVQGPPYDRLLDFVRPVSASYWFAPSAPRLAALGSGASQAG